MGKFIDISGQQFGRLRVTRQLAERQDKHILWECVCECGNVKPVRSQDLRNGKVLSCGCYARDVNATRLTEHGKTGSKVFRVWKNMRNRCTKPNATGYENYGGRGIAVCERWEHFEKFLEDMGEPPPGGSLDRIDNDKGYSPDNCRWATRERQQRNNRRTRLVTYQGIEKPLPDWCDELGLNYGMVYQRLHCQGWSVEEAFTLPPTR